MPAPRLGFVLADVTRLMRRAFRSRLRDSALTHTQARVLVHLAHDAGIRQIDLAERLEMQPIALSRVIDQLEQAGIVERRPDPADRRVHRITATASAAPHLDAIERVSASIRSDALRGVSTADAAIALSVLATMRANLSSRTARVASDGHGAAAAACAPERGR